MSLNYLHSGDCALAYRHLPGSTPGVLFCGGFNSSMSGIKATTLETLCRTAGLAYTRFDYSGHGQSQGEFTQGSIDRWLADTLAILDHVTQGPQLLVGSSMGAWIALLAALARPQRTAALLTIAAAPDFTERLLDHKLTSAQRQRLDQGETVMMPSDYDDGSPYPISPTLIQDSRQHCLLGRGRSLSLDVPVRLVHGCADPDVPYALSLELMQAIDAVDVELTLIKHADHRLSSPDNLELITSLVLKLAKPRPSPGVAPASP